MKLKKVMLVTFLLLAILTIGAVSASDDINTNETLAVEDIGEVSIDASVDDLASESGDDTVAASEDDVLSDYEYFVTVKNACEEHNSFLSPHIHEGDDVVFRITGPYASDFDLTVGENTYQVSVINGWAEITIYNMEAGEYALSTSYNSVSCPDYLYVIGNSSSGSGGSIYGPGGIGFDPNATSSENEPIDVGIWDEELSGRLYSDYPLYDVVSVDIPLGYDGYIYVEVNGTQKVSWKIKYYADYPSYMEWGLEDLGMQDVGDYYIVVKHDDEILKNDTVTVYKFGNDEFRALLIYEEEIIVLFCPKGNENNNLRITTVKEFYDGSHEKIYDESFSLSGYGGWSSWNLSDLGFEHDDVWTVFTFTITNDTGTVFSYENGCSVSDDGPEINIDIWDEDERGKLYTDTSDEVVSINVPEGFSGTVYVEVNGNPIDESWEIEFEEGDDSAYHDWGLDDLGISEPGNYAITVKLEDQIFKNQNITVYEFNNDEFRAYIDYENETINLYCPEGIEGNLTVTTEVETSMDNFETVYDETFDIADYPGWSSWALSDLGFNYDGFWTVFRFTVTNATDELYAFEKGYSREEDGIHVDVWDENEKGTLYTDISDVVVRVDVPKGFEGTVYIEVNGEQIEDSWEIEFLEEDDWVCYNWGLEQLEITEEGNYTIVVKLNDEILANETIEVVEFKNDTFRAEMNYEDYMEDCIVIFCPEGSEGTITIKTKVEYDEGNVDEKFEESYNVADYYGWNAWNLTDLGFEPNGEWTVFTVTIQDSEGTEIYSYSVGCRAEDEELDPFDDYEFMFANPNDEFDDSEEFDFEYDKASKVTVGHFYIPLFFENSTIYVYKNGEPFAEVYLTEEAPRFFNHKNQAIGLLVDLDLTKVQDKDVLSFYMPDRREDNLRYVVVEDKEDKVLFHDDYDPERLEFDVFYGNTTTGRLNNPELMGPNFDGKFLILVISDSLGITDGNITISGENSVISTKKLSECDREFDYGSLGYSYTIGLEDALSLIQDGENFTVSFTSGNVSFIQKRVKFDDYIYRITLVEDVLDQYTFNVADEEFTNESDIVINILTNTNRQAILIDLCGGYFTITVNGVKVENLGEVSFRTWANRENSHWNETDGQYIYGEYPNVEAFLDDVHRDWGDELELFRLTSWNQGAEELNITLADLGITESGTYNITITHVPAIMDDSIDQEEGVDAEYFIAKLTEVLSKTIVVNFEGTQEPATIVLVVSVDDIDYGNDALINVAASENFTGKVMVDVDGIVYTVNVTNGVGNVTVSALSAGVHNVTAFLQTEDLFNVTDVNFTVNKVDAFMDVSDVAVEYDGVSVVEIPVELRGASEIIVTGLDVDVTSDKISTRGALAAGTYTLNITAVPDDNHRAITKSVTITVRKAKSGLSLSVEKIAFDYGSSGSLSILLISNATGVSASIANHPAAVLLNGSVITVSGLNAGTFLLEVTTKTDENHSAVTVSVPVTVNKLSTAVSAVSVKTTYGTSKWLVITLTSNGTNLADKDVTVVIDKKAYAAQKLANGQYRIATPKALAVGKYPVAVSFAGETNYAASKAPSTVIAVYKATPKLTAKGKAFRVSDKAKKYVVVLRTDKNALYKGKVAIRVGGKTYTANAVKGKATFSLNKLSKAGNYLALVKFVGDKNYKAVTVKNVKIVVK